MKNIFAQLKKEWHPTKNIFENIENFSGKIAQKVWWLGECGHEWEATYHSRQEGASCPFCSKQKILAGFNDLGTQHPHLVKFWHPTKNQPLTTAQVFPNSKRKVWWLGECEHEWESNLSEASNSANFRCPYCSGYKALKGFNDLSTLHSELASQWHPTKNEPVTPQSVLPGSAKKVWWLGECRHEWEAEIRGRVRARSGCPYCTNKKLLPGYNDLLTVEPELAAQLDETKNSFTASSLMSGSHKKVWWVCNEKHSWEVSVHQRMQGYGCGECARKARKLKNFAPKKGKDLLSTHPLIASQLINSKNRYFSEEVSYGSPQKMWWQCEKGHEWEARISDRTIKNSGCPKCSRSFSSKEEAVANFFVQQDIEIKRSDKTVLPKQQLDIYLPEHNLAVEFNGLYWHSERSGKNKFYHYNKWLACKQQGIQLIQIWEDDWNRNPELLKKMLTHKLGFLVQEKTSGRKTNVALISKNKAEKFLEENHIQGFAGGTYYLGLENENALKAVLVLKKEANNVLNIVRYATSTRVQGGFTKLLKYAERTYKPSKFVTFSDNTVSDGGLYEKNGFTAVKHLPPDYMYVVKGERKHKFGYRLKKFKNDPNLLWEEGLTERELAQLNNIPRIWDAGKTKWEKEIK